MKIQKRDLYHGAVLTQIAEYPTFTSINKITEKEGVYQINDDKKILIKYSEAKQYDVNDGSYEWRFNYKNEEFEEFAIYEYFIILVCGNKTICLLSYDDINEILDTSNNSSQWITVNYSNKEQMKVNGSKGQLSHAVEHRAFPRDLLGAVKEEYAWPPLSKLKFYREPPELLFSSEDRMLDLTDHLASQVGFDKDRTVYFGLKTISHLWEAWTDENLEKVENLINYDLGFDGLSVDITRISDVICPYTEQQNIPCTEEFVWKLYIYIASGDDDEEDEDESDENVDVGDVDVAQDKDEKGEVRNITKEFPKLIFPKSASVCSIEIDVDYMSQDKKYQYGNWEYGSCEDFIQKITARWVKENSFSGKGTLWAWETLSTNFQHESYSVFYAVLGMPKEFRKYLDKEIAVLGKYVRPQSDYVTPNSTEGWTPRCHVEDGRAWEVLDAAAWKEIIV